MVKTKGKEGENYDLLVNQHFSPTEDVACPHAILH